MTFTDEFFEILGAWQKGWRENQDVRSQLAERLFNASKELPLQFKIVGEICYRKRFLHHGELFEIIMVNEKDEGIVSWTVDKDYAERFKGLCKLDAVSGAIFEHNPTKDEVVVNICSLWQSREFIDAAYLYKQKGGKNSDALFNFKASQGEVILSSPLKGSEIVALTGASSPFDNICDQIKMPLEERDDYFKKLLDQDKCPGELQYITKEGTQRVLQRTIKIMEDKIELAINNNGI